MNVALSATTVGAVAVITLASMSTSAVAQTLVASSCDYTNFMQTASGACVNLNHTSGVSPVSSTSDHATTSLDTQFYTALERLNISISRQNCESSRTLGYYEIDSNKMVMCVNNLKNNQQEYEATLIHESWHVVQDCADGLDNGTYTPVSLANGDSASLDSMASRLDRVNLRIIQSSYDAQDQPYEIEARYMENHPGLVLQGLNTCAANR
ncbi:MAG TPA: hypothetical protein V6D07_17405 [Trichocoleus sp.]